MTRFISKKNFAMWEKTLLYYDFPQVALLKTYNNHYLISVATDMTDDGLEYISAEISDSQLLDFAREHFDLRFLFEKPKFNRWYMFNVSDYEADSFLIKSIKLEEIDKSAMFPESGVFARDMTNSISVQRSQLSVQEVKLNGSWTMKDFSTWTRRVEQIYSMHLTLDWFRRDPKAAYANKKFKSFLTSLSSDWVGGGSYVSFYDSLKGLVSGSGIAVKKIHYASPGEIEIYADSLAFNKLESLVKNFVENRIAISEDYNTLDNYLKDHKLKECTLERFKEIELTNSHVSQNVLYYTNALSRSLQIEDYDIITQIAENRLVLAKIVLSFFRRTKDLSEYFIEGRTGF